MPVCQSILKFRNDRKFFSNFNWDIEEFLQATFKVKGVSLTYILILGSFLKKGIFSKELLSKSMSPKLITSLAKKLQLDEVALGDTLKTALAN